MHPSHRLPLCAALALLSGCDTGAASESAALRAPLAPPAAEALPAPREPAAEALGAGVLESRRTAIVTAAERVAPAVVSINVARRERVAARSWIEQFFVPPGFEREATGLGSGFVIRADGLVITNEHVVRDATEVVVTLTDGRELDGEVVGTDEVNDLALLRLRVPRGSDPLPVAPLGRSDDLMIGEWVVAIGNPFGYVLSNPEPSVTAGVVSATGRNIMPGEGQQRGYYLDMIQTDASINPGNSGGPLVNAMGEVVGVNSSILSSSGGNEGLGFAIPIDRARRIALALADHGRYRRAWTGAHVEAAGAERLRRGSEVRVADVVAGSPAERGGLRPGMVVRAVGAKRVRTPLDWEAGLLNAAAGETLEIRVDDGGHERVLRVRAEDLPSVAAERTQALRDFQLVTLTPAIRAERGLRSERGALIVGLSDEARRLGLREGDLILQVNRIPVQSADETARLLQRLRGHGVVMYFERAGRVASAQFTIAG
jgi:serine protease Do